MAKTNLQGADWLTSAPTLAVMSALETARPDGARFVGGCVRNTLMGRPVDDIDIATQLTPPEVVEAIEAAGLRAIPTGIEHGTITAIADRQPYEITTLRRDVETDGRRAIVAFTEDWAEDAARRDFRLNALYAEPNGTVHDPVGGGLEDAKAGRVIFIGKADERLREDYLRILRFYRFNAWYGAGIDADGQAACARQKDGLSKIAAERIWKELEKLLRAPGPTDALLGMEESGVLGQILPGASAERFKAFLEVVNSPWDPMRRLLALLPRDEVTAARVAKALRLSNAERDRLMAWAASDVALLPGMTPAEARAAAYRLEHRTFFDRVYTAMAEDGRKVWKAVHDAVDGWGRPSFPLRGQDLVERGMSGPEIGETLRALEDWWIEQDFAPGRGELLSRANSPPPHSR
ncbi:MAG: CCA tRNA nucleotidyltransferase [Pseudomonadota bacterium]